jgi:hypothetical protein
MFMIGRTAIPSMVTTDSRANGTGTCADGAESGLDVGGR